MDASPLVTIAIPTYNRADSYLPLALQSALSQKYSDLDILVSDNCSTDRTAELVAGMGDPRVRYFRHDSNIGQRNNYNFCFQQARGSYILLLHDDDMIDADFVSSCIESAAGVSDVGIIRTGVRRINADGNVISQVSNDIAGLPVDDFFHGWFSGKTAIYCCNTLFNTQKLRAIGNFQSKHFCYPDTAAIFILAAQHKRIDIRDIKASFRIHAQEEAFSRKITEWCEDSLELLDLMCDLLPQERRQLLKEGARFLATANYHRAATAPTPMRRLVGTMKVMKFFNYRQLPSLVIFLNILYGTHFYNVLRGLKRRLQYGFSRLASIRDA